ncbi:MAG: NTP transferase domain-containing protein [Lysobacterales bacterium]
MRFDAAELTTVILAGGAATRIGGVDKGLVLLSGRPLIATVSEAVDRMVWRASATYGSKAAFRFISANRNSERYAEYGPVIADSGPGYRGPLAGVAAALATARTTWVVTVPVDCPAPPEDLLLRLLAGLRPGVLGVVAHDGVRRQPLFALYHRELAASASKACRRGLGVYAWQDEAGMGEVDFGDRRESFVNLNTPTDFRDWEARHATGT